MSQKPLLWVVDDDESIRWVLERAFRKQPFTTESFASADALFQALEQQQPDVVLTDVRMPGKDGMVLLAHLQQHWPSIPVVVMTAHSDLDSAVQAFKGGAFEYLPKPFDVDEAVATVERALRQRQATAPQTPTATDTEAELIGEAPAMQEVFRAIGRLSRSSVSVLLTGESGTGKELVARALHAHSPRAEKPFVALNMAAIPNDLIESELFGHEKGAFTGADKRRKGRFEQANGGTLFLDEIGDMPLAVQTRLLRVLAEGQFYPVGGHQSVSVDVRIIAATHRGLENLVAEQRFREDLYHRLNVIRLRLPPLRERASDIPTLARYFLQQAAIELDVASKQLTKAAEQAMMQQRWPGNVRQLQNTCRWLTVMAPATQVSVDDLPEDIFASVSHTEETQAVEQGDWLAAFAAQLRNQTAEHDVLAELVEQMERQAITIALEKTGGHKQRAAEWLGWGRNTLTRKIQQFGL